MHQISFPPVRDRLEGLSPGECKSAGVLIMQNIPSRKASDSPQGLHRGVSSAGDYSGL